MTPKVKRQQPPELIPKTETSGYLDLVSQLNPKALAMDEFAGCLVGIGHFFERGVVLLRQPRILTLCPPLSGSAQQSALEHLTEDWPQQDVKWMQPLLPFWLGFVSRCSQHDLPLFCASVLKVAQHAQLGSGKLACPPVLVYSMSAMVSCLQRDGLSEEEALEHVDFNIIGGWMGPGTPLLWSRPV